MSNSCRTCGGSSFTVDNAVKMCDQCGTEQTNYAEYMSQEVLMEVDRSRFASQIADYVDEADAVDSKPKEALLNNWTSYEAFNIVLFEWTQALRSSGTSKNFQEMVFKLWVTYLQRMEVAFLPLEEKKSKKPKASIIENIRDVQLIHRGREEVVSCSMKRKRKSSKKNESLDKIMKKVEARKLKKVNKNTLSNYLTAELSKSILEMEEDSSDWESGIMAIKKGKNKRKKSSRQSSAACSVAGDDISEVNATIDELRAPVLCRNSFTTKHINKIRKVKGTDEKSETNPIEDENMKGSKEEEEEEEPDKALDETEKPIQVIGKRTQNTTIDSFKVAKSYIQEALPFHLNYKKLLSLLYLAVLLSEEDILLMDIMRWCREGHIPYLSAQNLLKQDMKMIREDLNVFRKWYVPTADTVQDAAGKMAAFLSIQYIPLPREDLIIERFVDILRLPEGVSSLAKELVQQSKNHSHQNTSLRIPDLEAKAMAAIISVVKLCYGLDGFQEVRLSQAAKTVNERLQDKPGWTHLFNWEEWERYMNTLLWFCGQVDAVFAYHFKALGAGGVNAKILSQFYWEEGIWRTSKTTTNFGHTETAYKMVEKLVDFQGKPLEDMIDQNTVLRMSRNPLMDIVSHFLGKFKNDKDKSMQQLVKMGRRLQRKTFKTYQINWAANLKDVQAKIAKYGSDYILQPLTLVSYKGSHDKNIKLKKYHIRFYDEVEKDLLEELMSEKSEKILLIPQPHRNVWRANWTNKKRNEVWSSCPSIYKWFISLSSLITETHRDRIMQYIEVFEKLR
ncbi:TATA box-binding protein-associated factor RNA polymerase I subunit B-like [Penaeus japonicus]|uniref:TATA box-binding protein-associated factor RNA polymerase I subunit B-like n=1 Tax=Penaeus japonicus TaxID=27405 RepID=UPI001C70F182|nr:TATA box-binding protein-associated factor RNA polymerase I subunit B-like [Penaeus japonicus]XP_042892298.1 TATA box-binding protein-associated factor RNA polymerase I subunit B-like [Penaeus japonicus]XP_042892304.1 TATA box-binding protein-associated factor RNA polymerase I subunit B-like [Penaeus japonicus]